MAHRFREHTRRERRALKRRDETSQCIVSIGPNNKLGVGGCVVRTKRVEDAGDDLRTIVGREREREREREEDGKTSRQAERTKLGETAL